jgi:cysteine desulfuration protein SufE
VTLPEPTTGLPAAMAEVVDEFGALSEPDRLQLLLEFSRELPELPARLADHPDLLEPVPECQSPIFLAVEVEPAGTGDQVVRLYFQAPQEAPTTRGFAGVLHAGLDGSPVQQVLDVPDDLPHQLGLDRAITPLRLRGMSGMLARIKRQVRERSAAAS